MIVKLKTAEEEREVETVEAYAVRTPKDDVQRFLKEISYTRIPKHLKRIKLCDDTLLILVEMVHEDNNIDRVLSMVKRIVRNGFGKGLLLADDSGPEGLIEIVKVPKHQPETMSQYKESRTIWPCIRSHRTAESPDLEYVSRVLNVLVGESRGCEVVCCGVCVIAAPDGILSVKKDTDNMLGHSILQAVEEVSKSQAGYLCTGLDAFILREPCLSCSVGFVHGRIKRVFCIHEDTQGFRPFSIFKINYHRSLNHRYQVYFVDETYKERFLDLH